MEVLKEKLILIRAVTCRDGLLDIRCDSMRSGNGNLNIVDAGIAPAGMFGLWKAADVG